jgi:hypothetical protein
VRNELVELVEDSIEGGGRGGVAEGGDGLDVRPDAADDGVNVVGEVGEEGVPFKQLEGGGGVVRVAVES